jgi:hypothetical protein
MISVLILSITIGILLIISAVRLWRRQAHNVIDLELNEVLKDHEVTSILIRLAQLKNVAKVDRRAAAKSSLLKARLKNRVPNDRVRAALYRIVDRMR